MKLVAWVAALTMSLAPAMAAAQQACPQNEVPGASGECVCADGYARTDGDVCLAEAVVPGGTAEGPLPVMNEIPAEAIVIGGLVLLGAVAIGIFAAGGGDDDRPAVNTN